MTILMDIILVICSYLYVLVVILIPKYLKEKEKISKFTARKSIHLLAGLSIFITPFLEFYWYSVIIAGSMMILTYFSSKESKVKQLKSLFDAIGEESEEKVGYLQGPFNYCLSIFILMLFFSIFAPTRFYFPISGILIMIVSDTLASVVGKKYGKIKIKIKWTHTERTIIGSLTLFLTAFIVSFFAYLIFGTVIPTSQQVIDLPQVIIFSFLTSIIATITELLSPSTYDDLTVPIFTTLIIFLLSSSFIA